MVIMQFASECVQCVRLPPLSRCPPPLHSLTLLRRVFIVCVNGQKAAECVQTKRPPHSEDKLCPTERTPP